MFNDIRVWGVGALALIALTNGGGARDGLAEAGAVKQERTLARQQERALAREARYTQSSSKVAVERVRAGCVPVLGSHPVITPEGSYREEVVLVEGMNADNGHGTPLDNTIVCTGRGDTAVVRGGVVTDVVRAGPELMGEYQSLFNQIPNSGQPAQVNLQY